MYSATHRCDVGAPPYPQTLGAAKQRRLSLTSCWNFRGSYAESRMHPCASAISFDHVTRSLATRSGQPVGWTWQLGKAQSGMPPTFRVPPAPYRENAFSRGPGFCCVCGQPVYQFGWHIDLWSKGPNKRATWHCTCVIAWQFWNAPSEQAPLLRRVQARRCGQTGGRLRKNVEVDHRVPLYRVWNEHRDKPWPNLLRCWGLPNLQVINRDANVLKCADESRDRRAKRPLTAKDAAVSA